MNLPQFPAHPSCTLCPLYAGAKSIGIATIHLGDSLAPSPGVPMALYLGMNPGVQEDQSGVPFIGPAGKTLRDDYIYGLEAHLVASIFITNAVRCGPNPKFPASCSRKCFPYTALDIERILTCQQPQLLDLALSSGGLSESLLQSHSSASETSSTPLVPPKFAVICCGAVATEAFFWWALHEKVSQQVAFSKQGNIIPTPLGPITHFSVYHPSAVNRRQSLKKVVAEQLLRVARWFHSVPASDPALSLPAFSRPRSPVCH